MNISFCLLTLVLHPRVNCHNSNTMPKTIIVFYLIDIATSLYSCEYTAYVCTFYGGHFLQILLGEESVLVWVSSFKFPYLINYSFTYILSIYVLFIYHWCGDEHYWKDKGSLSQGRWVLKCKAINITYELLQR